jgi:hypothetical protein
MSAFGDGDYIKLDSNKYLLQANFGGRQHLLKFNNNFTEFTSTRVGDNEQVMCKIIL